MLGKHSFGKRGESSRFSLEKGAKLELFSLEKRARWTNIVVKEDRKGKTIQISPRK